MTIAISSYTRSAPDCGSIRPRQAEPQVVFLIEAPSDRSGSAAICNQRPEILVRNTATLHGLVHAFHPVLENLNLHLRRSLGCLDAPW